MSLLFKFLTVIIGLYVLGGVLLFIFQRQFIYFPPKHMISPEGAGVTEVDVRQHQIDSYIGTYWFSHPDGKKPIIVFFHGNASSLADLAPLYRDVIDRGYGVVAIAYPNYPGGVGQLRQKDFILTAQIQIDRARQDYPNNDVVLYGTSLGAAVASHVAAEMDVELIILDAPFDSLTNRAQASMKLYPVGLLLRDKWNNIEALNSQSAPIVWIHGTQDTVIPLDFGQNLFDSYYGEKTAHIIQGGGHNDLWFRGGREIVLQELEKLND